MKDWQLFVVMCVLSFVMIHVVIFPNGNVVTRMCLYIVEVLTRIY